MYKVFLVDDEKWILQSLKSIIDWHEYGFTVIGSANNAYDAYEQISLLKPDVVFTDIRMPGMNGLELISKINDLKLGVQFIVVSGYAEFEYARVSMNYGAIGYCLKPFEKTEIVELLNKVGRNLAASRALLEAELLGAIEGQNEKGWLKASQLLGRLGFNCNTDQGFTVIVSIGDCELVFPEEIVTVTCITTGRQKRAYLLQCKSEVQDYWPHSFPDNIKGIGYINGTKNVSEIKEAIVLAELAAYNFFITSGKGVWEVKTAYQSCKNDLLHDLGESIRVKNIDKLEECIRGIRKKFTQMEYDIRHAIRIYNTVLSSIHWEDEGYEEEYIYSPEQLVHLFNDTHKMIDYLRDLIFRSYDTVNEAYPVEGARSETIKSALQYISENFFKDISIQDIADKFFVNPSYFSHLFKKEYKETFSQYLTRLRISHACELLRNTEILVNEIALNVGYEDYFYFARVFKKQTGKTPSEYRNVQ